jgi:pyruvate kinase
MALVWGVQTYLVERVTNTDKIFILVDDVFLGHDLVQKGEKVMVVAGFPPGTSGSTNDMRVYHVGDAHSGIAPAYREAAR